MSSQPQSPPQRFLPTPPRPLSPTIASEWSSLPLHNPVFRHARSPSRPDTPFSSTPSPCPSLAASTHSTPRPCEDNSLDIEIEELPSSLSSSPTHSFLHGEFEDAPDYNPYIYGVDDDSDEEEVIEGFERLGASYHQPHAVGSFVGSFYEFGVGMGIPVKRAKGKGNCRGSGSKRSFNDSMLDDGYETLESDEGSVDGYSGRMVQKRRIATAAGTRRARTAKQRWSVGSDISERASNRSTPEFMMMDMEL